MNSEHFSFEEHEGVLVATANYEESLTCQQVQEQTRIFLTEFAERIEAAGGIIGHLKAAIVGDAQVSTISTTGTEIHVTTSNADKSGSKAHLGASSLGRVHVVIALLVMCMTREVVEKAIVNALLATQYMRKG